MLISKIIDDILLKVYAGNPSDDISLERDQIKFWVLTNRDSIAKAYLDKQINDGKAVDTLYQERETGKAIDAEDLDDTEDIDERIFFTLTKRPMSLAKDMGVIKVITDEGLPVLKTSLERVEVIKDLRYAKPSPTNLVYYRTGSDINVLGVNTKNLTTTTFIVYYIPSLANQDLAETEDIKLQDDLIPVLLDLTEEVARRELFGVEDKENNGVQPAVDRQSGDWRLKELNNNDQKQWRVDNLQ
jgi:hypothetical protein